MALLGSFQMRHEMTATQSDVPVVAADLGLGAGTHRPSLGIDPQVHRRLAPALADRLQFDERIGQGEQSAAALEKIALKVGPEAVSENRNVELVADAGELKHLRAGQE